FSSNAQPFEDGQTYGRFRAYATLNHHGDLSAAAGELAKKGYGEQRNGHAPSRNGHARAMPQVGDACEEPDAGPTNNEDDCRFHFNPIHSAIFARSEYRVEWLVKRLLVRDQPGVVGGAMKSLKTSIALDLAISLGSGKPFLGVFDVYRKMRVCVLSG